jgi:hypothetical protein
MYTFSVKSDTLDLPKWHFRVPKVILLHPFYAWSVLLYALSASFYALSVLFYASFDFNTITLALPESHS